VVGFQLIEAGPIIMFPTPNPNHLTRNNSNSATHPRHIIWQAISTRMSNSDSKIPIPQEYFKSVETAEKYEAGWGGSASALASKVLSSYQALFPLIEGQMFHDNACGTGVVTREILSRSVAQGFRVQIKATDIAEPMLNILKGLLTNTQGGADVDVELMDSQVCPCVVLS
jgi:hypothetical protein